MWAKERVLNQKEPFRGSFEGFDGFDSRRGAKSCPTPCVAGGEKWQHNGHTTMNPALNPHNPLIMMEPLVGIEPTTYSLRVNCSTPELQRP